MFDQPIHDAFRMKYVLAVFGTLDGLTVGIVGVLVTMQQMSTNQCIEALQTETEPQNQAAAVLDIGIGSNLEKSNTFLPTEAMSRVEHCRYSSLLHQSKQIDERWHRLYQY
jgi:hypothetical protein